MALYTKDYQKAKRKEKIARGREEEKAKLLLLLQINRFEKYFNVLLTALSTIAGMLESTTSTIKPVLVTPCYMKYSPH